MIARHSFEQSGDGEGVEVVENRECVDDAHGEGQYTEKHIHLSTYGRTYNLRSLSGVFYLRNFHSHILDGCLIGFRPSAQKSSMSLKNRGTIIRIR